MPTTVKERRSASQPATAEPPALPSVAAREGILERARAVIAREQSAPMARPDAAAVEAKPPRLPTGRRVRLQMFCSGAGRSFIGIGLERNGTVQLIGAELASARRDGGGAPLMRAFTYLGALREWNCPVCRGAPAGVEAFGCDCACFSDVLHCGGRVGRNVHCACGGFIEARFRRVPSLAVRGHASPRTPTVPLGPARRLLSAPAPPPLLPRCLR
jgi:hypothetical protein